MQAHAEQYKITKLVQFICEHWAKLSLGAFTIFLGCSKLSDYVKKSASLNHTVSSQLQLTYGDVTYSGVTYGDVLIFIFFLIIVWANIAVWFKDHQRDKDIQLYRSIISNPDPEHALNKFLQHVGLRAFKFTHAHRVSIYKYDRAMKQFFRIGRYCPEPDLNEGGHREVYERENGVVGKAWNSDAPVVIEKLPDRNKSLTAYIEALKHHGIDLPRETIKNIRMPARSFYSYKVSDPNDGISIAVIIFESTKAKGFKSRSIKKFLGSSEGKLAVTLTANRELRSTSTEGRV